MRSRAPSTVARSVERPPVEVDPAGLDLREVEDVVDDREEGVAGGPDRVDVVALLGVERRVGEEPAHPDDRVHRRPDLVAHRGEERALGLVRLLGHLAGLARRAEQAGVVDGDRRLLRQADEEVEVRLGERPRRSRQTARIPTTPSRPTSEAAMSRSSGCSSVPGIGTVRGSVVASFTTSAVAARGDVPDDPLAGDGSGRP